MKRNWTNEETEKLTSMYRAGATCGRIATELGRGQGSVDNKLCNLGIRGTRSQPAQSDEPACVNQKSVSEKGNSSEIVWTTSTPVRTTEDALAKAEVNTSVWEVDRCVINSWEVGAKNDTGSMTKTPLWQVKLWLKRKKGWAPHEFAAEVVSQLKRPTRARKKPRPASSGLLAEIAIMDHHFGKLAWEPEVGGNYDVKIARDRYNAAADVLLADAASRNPARILLPLGNDFYHVDKGNNTTTAGTPQDCDGRWQKAYTHGLRCVRDLIDNALEIAPVDIIIVPGNHDKERAFTLGVMIAALYEQDARVQIDFSPNLKKRVVFGQNLLGFFHGHASPKRRIEQLPNEMAGLWKQEYAATTWREWHLGHLHSESEDVWRFRASESTGDMIVRRIPSLCGTDAWHYESGYRSPGAAEAHYYDFQHGRQGYRTVTQSELEYQKL